MTTKTKTKSAAKRAVKKSPQKTARALAEKSIAPALKPEIHFSPVLCIVAAPEQRLWSLTLVERLKKQFAKAGLEQVVDEEAAANHNGPVILVRGDAVIDQPLIPVLLKRPSFLLLSEETANPQAVAASVRGSDVAGIADVLRGTKPYTEARLLARRPSQLDMDFWKSLRKRETPYAMVVTTEWRMFMGTYKGATDLITKHLWPVPAFHATRFLAPLGVTPNMVTAVAAIMTALAFWFFLKGQFVPGLLAAWAMTFQIGRAHV